MKSHLPHVSYGLYSMGRLPRYLRCVNGFTVFWFIPSPVLRVSFDELGVRFLMLMHREGIKFWLNLVSFIKDGCVGSVSLHAFGKIKDKQE